MTLKDSWIKSNDYSDASTIVANPAEVYSWCLPSENSESLWWSMAVMLSLMTSLGGLHQRAALWFRYWSLVPTKKHPSWNIIWHPKLDDIYIYIIYIYIYTYIWRFPKIGVPPVIIHVSRIFPYKPSILGYPQFRKSPYVYGGFSKWGTPIARWMVSVRENPIYKNGWWLGVPRHDETDTPICIMTFSI